METYLQILDVSYSKEELTLSNLKPQLVRKVIPYRLYNLAYTSHKFLLCGGKLYLPFRIHLSYMNKTVILHPLWHSILEDVNPKF